MVTAIVGESSSNVEKHAAASNAGILE